MPEGQFQNRAASAEGVSLCFDLDNTLCSTQGMEYEAATPFPWAVERVNRLAAAGHTIVIMTARGSATGIDWEPVTRAQLERWGVTYHELRFGKPPAEVFIDDRAVHATEWQLGDAFAAPRAVPAPGHVTSVVEAGRTYAGRTLRLDEHAERARALAVAAGIRPVPEPGEIEQAVVAALPDEEGDVVFAIRISEPRSAAFPEAPPVEPLHVSFRPLAEAARGLALARSEGWPLGDELGAVDGGRLVLSEATSVPTVAGRWVEELAGGLGIEVQRGEPKPDSADEAFVVALPFGLLPLEGAPGPVTGSLLEAWSSACGVDLAPEVPASL